VPVCSYLHAQIKPVQVARSRSRFRCSGHYQPEIILLCVRWYLSYPLSHRQVAEMVNERGMEVNHSTIFRWVQPTIILLIEVAQNKQRGTHPTLLNGTRSPYPVLMCLLCIKNEIFDKFRGSIQLHSLQFA